MKYNFVGVRAGGGKSHALIQVAANRYQQNEKTLIVVPTKVLIDELSRNMQHRFPHVRTHVFYGNENCSTSVVTQVLRHLRASKLGAEIVMITHACFFSLPYFPNKSWYTVIFDESPSIYDAYELRLPETHQVLRARPIMSGRG